MAQEPNPSVTLAGSGVLLHVLNTSGEPVPVQGDDDGAIETVGGGGGGGGTVDQGAAGVDPWLVEIAHPIQNDGGTDYVNVKDKHSDDNATYLARIPTDPATDAKLDEIVTALGSPLQDGGNVAVTSLPLATNAATATNQLDILARLDPMWSALSSAFVGSKAARINTYFGQRTAFANTTQYHDVFSYLSSAAAYGGDMTGTEALEVVSSSINDTSAGTCARTIAYCYIDALNGDIETIATATLNGTTPVALGAGVRAKNIQWMEIRTTGSATHNEGTITLRTAGAGTTWEQIPALQRRSMSARYMVPAGYTAFVCNPRFSAQGQRMQFAIMANESEDGTALGATYTVHNLSSIPANFAGAPISGVIHKFSAGTRIKIAAIPASTAGSPIAETEFTILLVQN